MVKWISEKYICKKRCFIIFLEEKLEREKESSEESGEDGSDSESGSDECEEKSEFECGGYCPFNQGSADFGCPEGFTPGSNGISVPNSAVPAPAEKPK